MKAILQRLKNARQRPAKDNKVYTIDVTGGIGSSRHYGGVSKEQPLLSPSHSHSTCSATSTQHNQHNTTNTQHFSSQPPPLPPTQQQPPTPQQHNPMLYHNSANTINPADMQNSQFCYDRSSVTLYPPGAEAQDARLPPTNSANHQIGKLYYPPYYTTSYRHCFCVTCTQKKYYYPYRPYYQRKF